MSTRSDQTEEHAADIRRVLSPARLGTYERAVRKHLDATNRKPDSALQLYEWNAAISGAFLFPIQVCEVTVRNAVSDVLTQTNGADWPWSGSFERTLKADRKQELLNARRKHDVSRGLTGKVVADLNPIFWEDMLTSRYKEHIWNPHLHTIFPNMGKQDPEKSRKYIHGHFRRVRLLRNRIAHHEYIFNRNLHEDYQRILHLIQLRCIHTARWMDEHQIVTALIAQRPVSCGW